MQSEFEMSHMGELNYFLGLQIMQMNDGIFISQCKYAKELLKRFGMKNFGNKNTPISTTTFLDKDENGMDVKSAFLNGFIKKTVYVEQPPGFEHEKFPNHVFKLKKVLYGLKQAPLLGMID